MISTYLIQCLWLWVSRFLRYCRQLVLCIFLGWKAKELARLLTALPSSTQVHLWHNLTQICHTNTTEKPKSLSQRAGKTPVISMSWVIYYWITYVNSTGIRCVGRLHITTTHSSCQSVSHLYTPLSTGVVRYGTLVAIKSSAAKDRYLSVRDGKIGFWRSLIGTHPHIQQCTASTYTC